MSQFINFNTIIGNGKAYQVPIYQRDYSWEKDDWEDLWNDIEEIPNDKQHYMGYLVLQVINEVDQVYMIIDGQQRITTLSLLSLAVILLLKEWAENGVESESNKVRYEEEIKRYIGNFSTSQLTISPKLKLNRNNDDFYKSWLVALRKPPAITKLKPSQKLLYKGFEFFSTKLKEKFNNNESGALLTEFLEKIVGNGLVFTQILVQNDVDAFKVFETLNARGVKLSTADLLKNYLFSQAVKRGQLELDESEIRWQNIVESLRTGDLTTYIRHFWNSRNVLERQPGLFKAIKRKITDADKAFDFLNDLEYNVAYYASFNNPSDEIWEQEERKYLKVLNLLEVSSCYSLMLAGLAYLKREDYKVLLRELVAITFRYNISGLNPNEAERAFNKAAIELGSNKKNSPRQVVELLKHIYVTDDNFEQIFSTISINTRRNKSLVKYILVNMENHLTGNDNQAEDATSSIEHILPENAGSIWFNHFPVQDVQDHIFRFGNYTLLETSVNNKLDNNKSFNEKISFYRQSGYKMTTDYLYFEDWTPSTLSLHQKQMAKWAKAIWKSAYL
jgi:uncharacterized protein with ParB-like and HNH nuclease domain